jgi:hypothetical protein
VRRIGAKPHQCAEWIRERVSHRIGNAPAGLGARVRPHGLMLRCMAITAHRLFVSGPIRRSLRSFRLGA